MQVEAVDVSGRPETIPESLWIIKGQHYTVIGVLKDMNGVEYYVLNELNLAAARTLYKGFAASRFKVLEDDGVDELIEQLELEMV